MKSEIPGPITASAQVLNGVAAVSVAAMMLLTCADVLLRLFRSPIPGTYEMVGFLGAVFVSFSLAQTSLDKGHIAVDFFVRRFPAGIRQAVYPINALICAVLFGFAFWYCLQYALDSRQAGEVSLTLQMPIYPFILGTAIGCGSVCIVLIFQFLSLFRSKEV
jgi:TRAP-type C4-dicarboxylate transport system permease small subunit